MSEGRYWLISVKTRNTLPNLKLLGWPGQQTEPHRIKPYQPMDQDPRDRLRQQACQRGLNFVATAATAARHRTWNSQKQKVRLKRVKRRCYWHEYRLKPRGNDGSIKHAITSHLINAMRGRQRRVKELECKRVAICSGKSEPSPGQGGT